MTLENFLFKSPGSMNIPKIHPKGLRSLPPNQPNIRLKDRFHVKLMQDNSTENNHYCYPVASQTFWLGGSK